MFARSGALIGSELPRELNSFEAVRAKRSTGAGAAALLAMSGRPKVVRALQKSFFTDGHKALRSSWRRER